MFADPVEFVLNRVQARLGCGPACAFVLIDPLRVTAV